MKLSFISLLCGILSVPALAYCDVKLEPDERNVVATRLPGKWKLDPAITARLEGKETSEAIEVRDDPAALTKVPEKLRAAIEKQGLRIYMAGYMKYRGKEDPFVLTTFRGNTVVVGPSGDAAISIVTGKEKRLDLLFFGEAYEDNGPSCAYGRSD